jgi:pimeloyl-ACP methyl ester carboxylesterase
MAQFVRNFMAELEIEHSPVVGHSLGGCIGTRIVLRYPEVVEKLVLVASAGLGKEGPFYLRMISVPILGVISIVWLTGMKEQTSYADLERTNNPPTTQ